MAGTAADIVKVARSQLGTVGGSKYTRWYYGAANGAAWCAIFICWCANQAGVSQKVIPRHAWCPSLVSFFGGEQRYRSRASGYTPQPGDLVFFNYKGKNNAQHVALVDYCKSGYVHVIQGNAGSSSPRRVSKEAISLKSKNILGYGSPAYYPGTPGSSGLSSLVTDSPATELSKATEKTVHAQENTVWTSVKPPKIFQNTGAAVPYTAALQGIAPPELSLFIDNGTELQQPVVLDGVEWSSELCDTPATLTFTVLKDAGASFHEGNAVRLELSGAKCFFGFIFQKSREKDGNIKVTAYDQLRYLKNKNTYVYSNKKASEVLQMIARDFDLNLGEVADTGYVIPSRIEDNKTLFDIVGNALDETLMNAKKLYVLYDDFGKLTLRDIEQMKLDLLIDQDTAENFSYTSTIDGETYNQIKLTYENDATGKRDVYLAKDTDHINRWGVLQYYESLDNPSGAGNKAETLLSLYDGVTRKLTVKGCMGDPRVRGGSSVGVSLNLGDVRANTWMVVQRVKHTVKDGRHRMDLTLKAGEFVV